MDILAGFAPESVDMVLADPPYLLSNGGMTCRSGKAVCVDKGDWDKSGGLETDMTFHTDWLSECRRLLKPHGTIWLSGTSHSIFVCGFLLQSLGFHILNDIIWFKRNAPPNLSCRTFTESHETLVWAAKSLKARHVFNYEEMKKANDLEDTLKNPGKQVRDVWDIGQPRKAEMIHGKHPTQKPLALLERIVLASTNPGDLILDPFMGSGTTGVAALIHKRRFVGIEMVDEYLKIAKRRLEEAREIQLSLPRDI